MALACSFIRGSGTPLELPHGYVSAGSPGPVVLDEPCPCLLLTCLAEVFDISPAGYNLGWLTLRLGFFSIQFVVLSLLRSKFSLIVLIILNGCFTE